MPIEHYQRQLAFNAVPVIHPCVFEDDCSKTFSYVVMGNGADYVAEYDPVAAHVQQNGILLKTKATTPATDDWVRIKKPLWLPPHRLVRLQLVFSFVSYTPESWLTFALTWADGSTRHEAGFAFVNTAGAVSYISGGTVGAWEYTYLPQVLASKADKCWNKVDFTLDLAKLSYRLLYVNEKVYDMSEIPLPTAAAPTAYYLDFYIHLRSATDAQVQAWIDQILISPENP